MVGFSRSDESEISAPPGYTELYDKETGHICYHDNVRDVLWRTGLDQKGRLYFYHKPKDKARKAVSVWELPAVPSIFNEDVKKLGKVCVFDKGITLQVMTHAIEMHPYQATLFQSNNAPEPERKKRPSHQLVVLRKGPVSRKFASKPPPPATAGNSGKWHAAYAVLSEGYLLFFQDELGFRRMGDRESDSDAEE